MFLYINLLNFSLAFRLYLINCVCKDRLHRHSHLILRVISFLSLLLHTDIWSDSFYYSLVLLSGSIRVGVRSRFPSSNLPWSRSLLYLVLMMTNTNDPYHLVVRFRSSTSSIPLHFPSFNFRSHFLVESRFNLTFKIGFTHSSLI